MSREFNKPTSKPIDEIAKSINQFVQLMTDFDGTNQLTFDLTISHKTRDDKKWRHFQKAGTLHFHFLGEYSKLRGWKQWVLVENLTPFDEILR